MNAFGGGNSEFANGKAAMMLFGRWPQAGFKTNPNISLGVVAPPKDKVRANILFWGGFGIATSSQEADTAFKYLSYVSGEPGAQVWKDWALPAVKSVADSSGLTKDPIEGVWIGELNYLAPRVVHPKSWTVAINKVDCSREGVQHASKTKFQCRIQGEGGAGDYQRNQECGGNLSRT
jgi:ABC-type glycerol-3-phosphate transport system substrate-binding protein